jgi:hypothetical protein
MRAVVVGNARIDLAANQRVVKQRCAEANGAGTRNQKFKGVCRAGDAALADDRSGVPGR